MLDFLLDKGIPVVIVVCCIAAAVLLGFAMFAGHDRHKQMWQSCIEAGYKPFECYRDLRCRH